MEEIFFRYVCVIPVPCSMTGEKPVKAADNFTKDCGRDVIRPVRDNSYVDGVGTAPPKFRVPADSVKHESSPGQEMACS